MEWFSLCALSRTGRTCFFYWLRSEPFGQLARVASTRKEWGYHAPLDKEMHAALGIVLGKVTRTEDLYEDPTDPQGITATIYTLRVSRELRGKTPTLIKIRSENDSGRFWMDVGVEYLLFLSRDAHPGFYFVDSCGNSGIVSNRLPVLRQIEQSAP